LSNIDKKALITCTWL